MLASLKTESFVLSTLLNFTPKLLRGEVLPEENRKQKWRSGG